MKQRVTPLRRVRATWWAAGAFLLAAGFCAWLYSVAGPTGKAWLPNIGTDFAMLTLTVTLVDWIVRRAEADRLGPWSNRALREIGSSYRLVVSAVARDLKQTHEHTPLAIPQSSLKVLDLRLTHFDDEDAERMLGPDDLPFVVTAALHAADSMQTTLADDRPALTPDLIAAIDEYQDDARLAATIYFGMEDLELLKRAQEAIGQALRATRAFGVILIRNERQFDNDAGTFLFTKAGTWGTEPAPPDN
jgi:hypothetical protein